MPQFIISRSSKFQHWEAADPVAALIALLTRSPDLSSSLAGPASTSASRRAAAGGAPVTSCLGEHC